MWQGDSCCMPTIFLVSFKVVSSKFLGTTRRFHDRSWMYLEEDYRDAVFGADAWCHGSELFFECPTLFLSRSLLFDGFKLINYIRNAICTVRKCCRFVEFQYVHQKTYILKIMWQRDSCCLPTIFLVSFKLPLWFHRPVGSCILKTF